MSRLHQLTLERVSSVFAEPPTAIVHPLRDFEIPWHADMGEHAHAGAQSRGASVVEAVMSSGLSGVDANVTQAALAYLESRHPDVTPEGRATAGVIHATRSAFARDASYREHREAHKRIARAFEKKRPTGYRATNSYAFGALAPAPEEITGLMEDLADFVESHDATVLVAAVAHAQFENISPYGEQGSPLSRALLAGHLGVPVSRYLHRNRAAYNEALLDFRRGDAAPIVSVIGDAYQDGLYVLHAAAEDRHLTGFNEAERRAAARVQERPVGSPGRMLRGESDILVDGFNSLHRRRVITEASVKSHHTVYAYLPLVREWIRLVRDEEPIPAYHDDWRWRMPPGFSVHRCP